MNPSESDNPPPVPAVKGLLILSVVIGMILGFVALCGAFNIKNFWVGFLFMFYWMGLEQARMGKFLPSAIGAVLGLLVSFCTPLFSAHLVGAEMGVAAGLGVTIVILYLRILGRLNLLVNQVTVLFLTVGSIPVLHPSISGTEMFASLSLGLGFFGSLGAIGAFLERRRVNRLMATATGSVTGS